MTSAPGDGIRAWGMASAPRGRHPLRGGDIRPRGSDSEQVDRRGHAVDGAGGGKPSPSGTTGAPGPGSRLGEPSTQGPRGRCTPRDLNVPESARWSAVRGGVWWPRPCRGGNAARRPSTAPGTGAPGGGAQDMVVRAPSGSSGGSCEPLPPVTPAPAVEGSSLTLMRVSPLPVLSLGAAACRPAPGSSYAWPPPGSADPGGRTATARRPAVAVAPHSSFASREKTASSRVRRGHAWCTGRPPGSFSDPRRTGRRSRPGARRGLCGRAVREPVVPSRYRPGGADVTAGRLPVSCRSGLTASSRGPLRTSGRGTAG
ncbi:hypothetical protein ACVW0K_000327 [Streptomyces filamentosus]